MAGLHWRLTVFNFTSTRHQCFAFKAVLYFKLRSLKHRVRTQVARAGHNKLCYCRGNRATLRRVTVSQHVVNWCTVAKKIPGQFKLNATSVGANNNNSNKGNKEEKERNRHPLHVRSPPTFSAVVLPMLAWVRTGAIWRKRSNVGGGDAACRCHWTHSMGP